MISANMFLPQQGALSDLAAWIAGDLGTAYARLYTNPRVFSPTDTCADYTEAAWPGYVPVQPLVWTAPVINGGGKAETDSQVLTYTYSSGLGTGLANGIYITDPGKTKLLAVFPFLAPVVFAPATPTFSFGAIVTQVSEL